MRDIDLVNALRCISSEDGPTGDCKKCPFYKTVTLPEDLAAKVGAWEWSACDVDAVGFAAADRIANQNTNILALQREIEKLRGDLKLHRCATCDFWRENDPRCMNGQSQWGGKAVPKDNYCLYWEHHTDWIPVAERLPEEIDMDHEAAEQLRHLCRNCDLDRLEELAEADRAGLLVVLPFTSGRTLLCKENIDSPRLMKDVELAIRYCSSCGIVFHMGYNVFCDLVKHGRITAVSEETEKALEAMKDETR